METAFPHCFTLTWIENVYFYSVLPQFFRTISMVVAYHSIPFSFLSVSNKFYIRQNLVSSMVDLFMIKYLFCVSPFEINFKPKSFLLQVEVLSPTVSFPFKSFSAVNPDSFCPPMYGFFVTVPFFFDCKKGCKSQRKTKALQDFL